MNIALIGYYNHNNFGDDLLQNYLTEYLKRYGAVTVYSDCEDEWGVRNGLKDKSFLKRDLIVIGGGSIVQPGFWVFQENLFGKQIVFLNVNVGEITNEEFRAKLVNLKAKWFVRDTYSVECLEAIGIKAIYVPDIVSSVDIEPKQEQKKISVFLNSYIFNKFFSDNQSDSSLAQKNLIEIAKYLDWMMEFDWKVEIIPCQIVGKYDDRIVSTILYGYVQNKDNCKMHFPGLPNNSIIRKIQESKFILSSRFHSTVLAIKAQKNFIDITHHDKNRMFLKDNGLEDHCIDYYLFNKESLIEKTQSIESKEYVKRFSMSKKIWDNLNIV